MRKASSVVLGLLCLGVVGESARADSTWEFSVQASASVQVSPPQITLAWPQDTYMLPNTYTIFRKAPGASSWGNGISFPGTATNYTDNQVSVGTAYEYQIIKTTSQYTGYGYVSAAINLPPPDNRGRVLLVLDNAFSTSLSNELSQLQQDLTGDGWTVARIEVNRTDSVSAVKALIKAQYANDPANVKAVFLFGHVPVPYSGDIVPDGHTPDHQGAWPCDGFYGDMDGNWTDNAVNDTSATEARIRNVPGDGKFDQSSFPAPLKLMVGRVDLANMPGRLSWNGPATFPSEVELLRNYLKKDHQFRHKQFDLPRRCIVGDHFGYRNGEAFAASGWRNASAFFTAANISNLPTQGTWVPTLSSNACLLAYGCGAGSYTSIGGLGNSDVYHDGITTEFMANDVKTAFALLFGSWLGDWDSEDNILRSVLALPSYGLASAWSGRPHWFMHHMALGEPIGFSARLTQNNGPNGLYQNQLNSCAGLIHIALMGDPTLRLHAVAPPANLQSATNGSTLNLSWTASSDSVAGYHVYRASTPAGPFVRLTSAPVTTTSFSDSTSTGAATYMVRALKLETSGGGTYYNLSQGAFLNGPAGSTNTSDSVVVLTAPSVNSVVSGAAVTVSANASAASGIAGVQFKLDGNNLSTEITAPPYTLNWDTTSTTDGPHSLSAVARENAGSQMASANVPVAINNATAGISTNNSSANAITWVDDALPGGAVGAGDGGDTWNWVSSNPAPYSGNLANQSSIATGLHQHFFSWASQSLTISTGDVLSAFVYLDPNNLPKEVMLQWNDGTWEHRAYWGANRIGYGSDGTASRRFVGPLPAAGQWVRLQVPAAQVGLEGSTVTGMAFSQFDGRATWDSAGKTTALSPTSSTNTDTGTNVASSVVTNLVGWVDDSLPAEAVAGSDGGDSWNWTSATPAPYSGSVANQSSLSAGLHQHYFAWAANTLTVNSGDVLIAYVYPDTANPPSELMLQWNDGTWEHRAYWGANLISYGTDNSNSRRYMGLLPAAGQWTRLEIPASQVGLEGSVVSGMAFSQFDGRATWDLAGKGSLTVATNSPAPATNTAASTSWVDDTLPAGAVPAADGGDGWNWIASNPAPMSGSLANQSSLGTGLHQHYFTAATATLTVKTGEVLYANVYLDPANLPSEVMLQWNNGTWEHRAYWGDNLISYGAEGTASRHHMGPLPTAGQWVRLEVPASEVALDNAILSGMALTLFNGRATWDDAGKASSATTETNVPPVVTTNSPPAIDTNSPPTVNTNTPGDTGTNSPTAISSNTLPGVTALDFTTLVLPPVGSNTLHILAPNLLELKLINTKQPDPARVTQWDLVDANNQFKTPAASAFAVTADGKGVAVVAVGFKRRPIYAPFEMYDLRIENSLYLQLATPVSDNQVIEVKNPDGTLWASSMHFQATADPLRYSPAIHVNGEGYLPNFQKKAMVGYFIGNLGEMNVPAASGFKLVDAVTGAQVFQGTLAQRLDVGYTYSPTPYQQVYEADFSAFNTPGEYRLVVPGLGGSLPFLIDNGIAMTFARTYALGIYHQRCGTNTTMPYTRFEHGICHSASASVPWPASSWPFTWTTVSNYGVQMNPDNPTQTAPTMNANSQLFPFLKQGTVDTTGGHHDAGDYSKYTINSASFIHYLMFAVDSLQGVASLDNLGLPESGDGISDVMQEVKWEADFLARLQDTDGGFYFLVYPQNREYEAGVTPDHGDPQVVWPKTTSVTAASVAALAQCASSPLFKQTYPQAAAAYMQKALLGWQFLTNAIAKYGKTGAYQKITHYGDTFADQDELAWAACQMYLATGDPGIHAKLLSWFDPSNPATYRWGWWHLSECYGHAIRSYAFAQQSGRVNAAQLDSTFLAKCRTEIAAAGDAAMNWSSMSAYGTSFPDATKRVKGAGWYFSTDQAFDIAVAQQLNPKTEYLNAIVANMNYEAGCNPLNVSYVTGLGWKRQRDIVSQWHMVTPGLLPPSGIPVGNVTANFGYLSTYGGMLETLCFPSDNAATAPYPFYDRWGDSWNVTAEMVILNQARSLGTLAYLAAQTPLKTQAWKSVSGQIAIPNSVVPVGAPVTLTMQAAGVDLSAARITWETRDLEPGFGSSFTFSPQNNGTQWVEAEALLPDGRRVFAATNFPVNSPDIIWVNDSLPTGAIAGTDGGDSWLWVTNNPTPFSGNAAHQSALASGEHQHYFDNATATLAVGTGDVLYAYVYLDPNHPPSEVMLQWNAGTWEHRAYWGANSLGYGQNGTPSRQYMGNLPASGQWVQLKVPARDVNLEGSTIKGMAFTLYGGTATFDAAGRLSQLTNSSPTITVSAAASTASRLELSPGTLTFTRSGDASSSLSVNYSLAGNASPGSDYQLSPPPVPADTVIFPTGATSVTLDVLPLPTTNFVGAKTVVVSLGPGNSYQLGSPAVATITVEGNTVPVQSLTFSAAGATMQWSSTSNRVYRVGYKNSLSDSSWTPLSVDILATNSTTTWLDTTAAGIGQRFYLVAEMR